jgi:hypothetical protein
VRAHAAAAKTSNKPNLHQFASLPAINYLDPQLPDGNIPLNSLSRKSIVLNLMIIESWHR